MQALILIGAIIMFAVFVILIQFFGWTYLWLVVPIGLFVACLGG